MYIIEIDYEYSYSHRSYDSFGDSNYSHTTVETTTYRLLMSDSYESTIKIAEAICDADHSYDKNYKRVATRIGPLVNKIVTMKGML